MQHMHKRPKRKGNTNNKKNKRSQNNKTPTKVPSLNELIEAGDAATASMEGEKALAFYASAERLLREKSSDNNGNNNNNNNNDKLVYVLEKMGESKASMGDIDGARQHFENAIESLKKNSSTEKNDAQYYETMAGLYLYIGQISSELQALEVQKKGLQSLELCVELRQKECQHQQQLQGGNSMEIDSQKLAKTALYETRQKLGQAYASVAELYLTDLCYEDNAETECESYVDSALKIVDSDGEPLVDALQTAASLRLSQSRKDDARKYILRAYDRMKNGCEALAKLVGLEENSKRTVELTEVDAVDSLPSFEFRSQTAKLLLECAAEEEKTDDNIENHQKQPPHLGKQQQERQFCKRAAIHVLGSLLAENDEVPECYYLLGCAFMAAANEELASYYWSRALELLTSVQKELEKAAEETDMDDDDDELEAQMQAIACQIEEISSKLEEIAEADEQEDSDAMEE